MIALIAIALQVSLATVAVVDGDTVHDNRRNTDYRLFGIDTPETLHGKCAAEKALGHAAAARLAEILSTATTVTAFPGWDPRGRDKWPRDGFGRRIARIEADGADVGEILLREGHARRWKPGQRAIDWCRSVD